MTHLRFLQSRIWKVLMFVPTVFFDEERDPSEDHGELAI